MAARRARWQAASAGGNTFGEELAQQGLIEETGRATRDVIAASNGAAVVEARVRLRVISCFDCTAPKACCSMHTGAYLHEAVAIAARLIDEGRDTPGLRAALGAAAEAMETFDEVAYRRAGRPCVLLGDDERCTVYEDRPSVCGAHLVTSPAARCADPLLANEGALVGTEHVDRPRAVADEFGARLGLRPLDVPYRGALPRMVLIALEAWHRRDYVTFLAEQVRPAVHRYRWALR